MNVLLTGASGFIGRNLIENVPEGIKVHTLPHEFLADPSFELPRVEAIIHAAGYAAPSLFMAQPIDTLKVNTLSVFRLLEESLKPGGTFLYCSSGEIYRGLEGEAKEHLIGTTTPYHERAPYIEGKRCGEAIVNSYRKQGVNAISARIGLTYGPGTRRGDARVINQFIESALKTGKINLRDNGAAFTRLCYSKDMAKMLWNVLLRGHDGLYNVGGIEDKTIASIALEIASVIGADVNIPGKPEGVSQFKMDVSNYVAEFGTTAFTYFYDGIRETIQYQRRLYGIL